MAGLLQDLRYALRQLGKNRGFTAVAILTLALGIGATTAIFSVVYGVLLGPLPYADPTRIVAIFEIDPNGGHNRLADPNFDDFRDQSHSFQAIAKYRRSRTSLHSSSGFSAFSRLSAAIWSLPTTIKARLRSRSSATDTGNSISDHLQTFRSCT